MPGSSELVSPTDAERAAVAETMSVPVVRASDFSGYLDVLRDPKNSPLRVMQVERQSRNDCQGNATANGEEYRTWYCSGRQVMPTLSEMFAYQASEFLMSEGQVGKDQGTSIHSGVRLLVDGVLKLGLAAGLPMETAWPYSRWCRSPTEFQRYCSGLKIEAAHVTESGPMPDWDGALAAVAAGSSIHIGTYWGVNWKQIGNRRCMDSAPRPAGGHATEIIWAEEIGGQWYLAVWNSHGDGYYLMSRRCYDQLQKDQCEPFGGFLLAPDKMAERYDRITTGGGYF
jgi:hypothetical protein